MPTYPLATLAVTVTATGPTAPPYSDIYASLQASFRTIYGTDSYLDPDSQDGQLLAVFAKAIKDANDATIAAYNNYSPASSYGTGLSNQVKINGIARAPSSNSQATLLVVGVIGTVIEMGVAGDDAGNRWLLNSVVIPAEGQILVNAIAADSGNIEALSGSITRILTPMLGWQSVTNVSDAVPGAAVELDAALRRRQAYSTALPSKTVLDGIVGAVASLDDVLEVRAYENDTDAPDANGLPEHSMALVVRGGDPTEIARAYLNKKSPGAYTYGDQAVELFSATGVPYTIRYFIADEVRISVAITIKAMPAKGYTTAVGLQIKQSVADYINGLEIGNHVDLGRLYLPAQFYGATASQSFEVNVILVSAFPASPAAADVPIAFNARAICDPADVALTVT